MSTPLTDAEPRSLSAEVAEEIRVAMLRRRVTGIELARHLGVSSAWVSYRLNGLQAIDLNDLERIAGVLGVTVVDLLPRRRRAVTETYPRIRIPGPRTPVTRPSQTHVRPPDGRPGQPNGSRRPRYIGRP